MKVLSNHLALPVVPDADEGTLFSPPGGRPVTAGRGNGRNPRRPLKGTERIYSLP